MASFRSAAVGAGQGLWGLAKGTGGAINSYRGTRVHRAGMKGITQDILGIGQGKFGKALGWGSLAAFTLMGYQEGGLWGAAKGAAGEFAISYGFRAGLSAIGLGMGAISVAGGVGLAAAGGTFALAAAGQGVSPLQLAARPKVHEYMKKRARLEMASPINDTFGNVSTMRQRSISAMRQSKITARSALGMEANRRYVPYMR